VLGIACVVEICVVYGIGATFTHVRCHFKLENAGTLWWPSSGLGWSSSSACPPSTVTHRAWRTACEAFCPLLQNAEAAHLQELSRRIGPVAIKVWQENDIQTRLDFLGSVGFELVASFYGTGLGQGVLYGIFKRRKTTQ